MLLNSALTQLLAICPAKIIPLYSSTSPLSPLVQSNSTMPFRLSSQYFNPSLYRSIRSLWFEGIPDTARVAPEHAMKRWFTGSKEEKEVFDRVCHQNFRTALDSIGPSSYQLPPFPANHAEERQQAPEIARPFVAEIEGATEPETPATVALSMILLLDQMTRNIFRADQHLIYAHYDRISRAIVDAMLQPSNRWDLAYKHNFVYRSWFYMPLMHSEHLKDHHATMDLCLEAQEDNAKEGGEEGRAYAERNIKFEKLHLEIVEKFGRYPHRNQVMGREDTKAEREYLESPNAQTFGTG